MSSSATDTHAIVSSDETEKEAPLVDRWQTPAFEPGADLSPSSPGVSIKQLEALQRQAYEEAYANGLEDGFAAGIEKSSQEAERLGNLVQQLSRPFEKLDESVEKQVVQLAMVVARHVIRREIKTEPAHVIGAVREALKILPVAARDVRVRLHPEDAELVRQHLKTSEGDRAWSIEEDPVLTRGGCRIKTEYSHVDARIESRISAIIATLFGDERESEDAHSERLDHD